MPRKKVGRSAALVALLLALQLKGHQHVEARFRGAVQKAIPTVGSDGGVVNTITGKCNMQN